MRPVTTQDRLGHALDSLASLTFRKRVRSEDSVRHARNGHDPRSLEQKVSDLQKQVAKLEKSL